MVMNCGNLPQSSFTQSARLQAACRLANQRGAQQLRYPLRWEEYKRLASGAPGIQWIQQYHSYEKQVKSGPHSRTRSPSNPTSASQLRERSRNFRPHDLVDHW
jgi:hypothetical protein